MGGNLALFSGFLKASTKMHNDLLSRVLRWPMWLFDTTPTGRVLNRFGDDVDVIDYTLATKISKVLLKVGLVSKIFNMLWIMPGRSCKMQFWCLIFQIGSTLFIISYTTPIFIIVCVLLIMCFGIIQVSI